MVGAGSAEDNRSIDCTHSMNTAINLHLHLLAEEKAGTGFESKGTSLLYPEAVVDQVRTTGGEASVAIDNPAAQYNGILAVGSKLHLLGNTTGQREDQRIAHLERLVDATRVDSNLDKHEEAVAATHRDVAELRVVELDL